MQLNINPKSRQNDLVVQELPGEVLICDLKTNKAFCLNQTAAFVWLHADGETSVGQIARLLQKKLRTPVDESGIWFALERLDKDGLLANKTQAPLMFAGMNRRDLIKSLGKSAAVALPLVMAITAPRTADAQSSCTSSGGPCAVQGARPCSPGLNCTPVGTCGISGGGNSNTVLS
jgi:hypothetical protein